MIITTKLLLRRFEYLPSIAFLILFQSIGVDNKDKRMRNMSLAVVCSLATRWLRRLSLYDNSVEVRNVVVVCWWESVEALKVSKLSSSSFAESSEESLESLEFSSPDDEQSPAFSATMFNSVETFLDFKTDATFNP